MKKIHFLSILAILLAMFVILPSCKDDKEDITNGQDPGNNSDEDFEDDTFWDVMSKLVSGDDITDDYEGKTFDPSIGLEDSASPQIRIVATNTMEAAARCFASLTGADIDENTATYEWKDEKVGSMTYRKVNDGKDFAIMEVNIPSILHLSQIIYRNGMQMGENGKFTETAFYRFGDVISKVRAEDGVTEYWVCVCPAFGPEGKENTHWVSVSPLPDKDILYYTGSNNYEYALPKKLKNDLTRLQIMAEMLYAICYPDVWYTNLLSYKPTMFHDFERDNAKYHNNYFWTNVAQAWREKGIDKLVFGKSNTATCRPAPQDRQ